MLTSGLSTAGGGGGVLPQPKAPSTENPLDARPTLSLKHFSTLLLLSAYLASHTPPKHDIILFSRLSSGSKSYKVRRRKIFAASAGSGSKKSTTTTSADRMNVNAQSKTAKALVDAKAGVARPFTMERVCAILRAVHPVGVGGRRGVVDRVGREMGELVRLRVVVCVGAGAGGEDGEERWRVNVGREVVEGCGRRWGVGMREYEIE